MNQINDVNLVYLEDEDKYILKLYEHAQVKNHTSFTLKRLNSLRDKVSSTSCIENMVDIHDSIFSGTNIKCSSPSDDNVLLRGFSIPESGEHFLECANNMFVTVNTKLKYITMMVDEKRIYSLPNAPLFTHRFLGKAREINPEYFGVGDCLP